MLDISIGSYLAKIAYESNFLKQLNSSFLYYWRIKRNIVVAEYLSSMDIKFGLMLFARDALNESVRTSQIHTHYHLADFIYNTKALLDTIANILNCVYALGFKGSRIDLCNKEFFNELKKEQDIFTNNISNLKGWFI